MNRTPEQRTAEDIAARFEEAVHTGRRLPAVRVQGYFNVWPPIVRTLWERLAREDPAPLRFPPDDAAVQRMLEVMRWVQWLDDVETRHLVWMRAEGFEWRPICCRFGCDRTTAWRRWQRALNLIAARLNGTSGEEAEATDATGRAVEPVGSVTTSEDRS